MVVMHNDIAEIFRGVFGKKFSGSLDEAFSLSDTSELANCSCPKQVNTSSLTAACSVHVFQKYPDSSSSSPGFHSWFAIVVISY
jgi:hypothetical protein